MQDFTWAVDVGVIVLVVISAYLAMVRGAARELLALASWIIAFFAAFHFAPSVKPRIPSLDGMGSFLGGCEAHTLFAFVVVFGLSLIVTGILFWILSGPTTNARIGAVNQGLGLVYGAARGLVLVAVVYIGYRQISQNEAELAFVENAFTTGVVRDTADMLMSFLPTTEMPRWFGDRAAAMMSACAAEPG
jgi:membrane protein required for colicin V production